MQGRSGTFATWAGQLRLGKRRLHVNNLDYSTGAFSARRRGLGIFALASLTWLPNRRPQVLFDPILRVPGVGSAATQPGTASSEDARTRAATTPDKLSGPNQRDSCAFDSNRPE